MSEWLGRACSLWLLLHLLRPHLTTPIVSENTWLKSVMRTNNISRELQKSTKIGERVGLVSKKEKSTVRVKKLTRSYRHRRDGGAGIEDTPNWSFQTFVPPRSLGPGAYTRPIESRLPLIYWLSVNHTSPVQLETHASQDAGKRDLPTEHTSSQFIARQSGTPSSRQTQTGNHLMIHYGGESSTDETQRITVSAQRRIPVPRVSQSYTPRYSITAMRERISSVPLLQSFRGQIKARSGADESRYLSPHPVASPQTQRFALREAMAEMATSVMHYLDRVHQARNLLRSEDSVTEVRYDYLTPLPPPDKDPSHVSPPTKSTSTSLPSTHHSRPSTAAPDPMPEVPTPAPRRQLWPQTVRTRTTTTRLPTPRPALLNQHIDPSGDANGMIPESGPVAKRTTPMRGSHPTLSTGVLETVCLQYLSVEHDVDCGRRRRRSAPSSHHLSLLLQYYGGTASSPFTAPTLHQAVSTFRNLMPLGIPATDDHVHMKFTADKITDLLNEHYRSSKQDESAPGPIRQETGNTSEDDLQLPPDFLEQMVPMQHVTFNTTNPRNRRSFNPADHRTYDCNNSVDCQHFNADVCPDRLTEMALDEHGCDTCQCAIREAAANGYCHYRSPQSSVRNARVRLCTQCQLTRDLGPQVFPSYIQEVVCYPNNSSCLEIGGPLGAQGQCQDSYIPVSVLRRIPGRCMRVNLADGQSLLFDDWRLAQQMIRTGCQCMVDKRSPLAANLN